MARLAEVKSWMSWWGWSDKGGTMLKLNSLGEVIGRRGDEVWNSDMEKAIETDERLMKKEYEESQRR